jgi:anti-sigma factor ChrR (cupin superfamily)
MKHKTVFLMLFAWTLVATQTQDASAQATPGSPPVCMPATQSIPQPVGARGPAAEPTERIPRNVTITAIPGVVAAGAMWTKVWQGAGNSADGIVADRDDNALVAQEDFDTVLKIDKNDKASVYLSQAKGVGSLSIDRQGRLYGAHRTERPGSTKPDRASIVNAITMLAPERKTVAAKWTNGMALTVRPNDLAADGQGGAYFTSTCVYYANANGTVSVMAENIRTNGIVFSPDDKILYVTNGGTIVAFDVKGPGVLANRRDFAKLAMGNGCPSTRIPHGTDTLLPRGRVTRLSFRRPASATICGSI